ncbi:MAG: pilus assembly protein PilM [Ruminococcus sp.]|nr:pilus assembly protein PilM [Ruminococcus sp.]
MLSFDITDRNIRVVKGVESNGKIKISSAATLNLEEGLIVNGHVKDGPTVATLINGALKKNKMPDKEAIVSLSSNLTIFKELIVPRVKPQDMQKTVKQQMQAELNLDDTFSVTYAIVGDAAETGDNGEPMLKVLATACPYEIVNSYKDVFKLLGISLKSVMVGCNCITKVLLADTRIKSKMPLLAVQIDPNFISLNLYEQGQLSFSRFASIDPDDYGNSPDYVFEAVNENIFRMLQFHRSRNTGEIIENVIFYGDTHEYVRLTDELEKLDLNTSLINVPPQIHGHENLEFSLYANAIGAMFKRNKDTEKINLLETEISAAIKKAASGGKVRGENAGLGIMLGLVLGSAVIVGGTWAVMSFINSGIEKDIVKVQDYLESPEVKNQLDHRTKLLSMRETVNAYEVRMQNSYDAFYSQPVINGEKYDTLQSILDKTAEDLDLDVDECFVSTPTYSEGVLSFSIEAAGSEDYVQKLPSIYVDNLLDELFTDNNGYYANGTYDGYTVQLVQENKDSDEKVEKVRFNVSVALDGRQSAYHPEEEAESSDEDAA